MWVLDLFPSSSYFHSFFKYFCIKPVQHTPIVPLFNVLFPIGGWIYENTLRLWASLSISSYLQPEFSFRPYCVMAGVAGVSWALHQGINYLSLIWHRLAGQISSLSSPFIYQHQTEDVAVQKNPSRHSPWWGGNVRNGSKTRGFPIQHNSSNWSWHMIIKTHSWNSLQKCS